VVHVDGDQYFRVVEVPVLKLVLVVNVSSGKMLHCACIVDGIMNKATDTFTISKNFFMGVILMK